MIDWSKSTNGPIPWKSPTSENHPIHKFLLSSHHLPSNFSRHPKWRRCCGRRASAAPGCCLDPWEPLHQLSFFFVGHGGLGKRCPEIIGDIPMIWQWWVKQLFAWDWKVSLPVWRCLKPGVWTCLDEVTTTEHGFESYSYIYIFIHIIIVIYYYY